MSSTDGNEPGLRIGGWIPPYDEEQRLKGLEPIRHVAVPIRPELRTAHRADAASRRRRAAVIGGAVVTAVTLAGLTLAYQAEGPVRTTPGAAQLPQWPDVPFVPVPIESSPVPSSTPVAVSSDVPEHRVAWPANEAATRSSIPTPSTTPARSSATSAAASSPPAPAFVVGAMIGLEPAGRPDYRVRHRDFQGRVERVGPGSSSLDRADSRFVVRAGQADPDCVSLESVNYPGYFLRHEDLVLRLRRGDGSWRFAADATFCPATGRSGTTLRSINYPDRYWAELDSTLVISTRNRGAFVVRPPL